MRKCHPMRTASWLIVALCVDHSASVAVEASPVVPGELMVDPPTLKCLAFRWFIDGDYNGSAHVRVRFRKSDSDNWQPALQMLRIKREVVDVDHAPFTCGNLFAGSIVNLDPATSYDVQLTMTDRDGGSAVKTVTVRTRGEPRAFSRGRTLHVYPVGYRGPRKRPAFDLPRRAARAARPGDIVLLHAGTYRGQHELHKSGTAERPIVYRAAGDGEVIFDGGGIDGNIIELQGGHHHVFIEGITIRNGRTAIKANDSNGLVVRRCRIEDVKYGIVALTPTSGWYLADNTITGRDKTWYPRGMRQSHTGIIVLGTGHVVCHNRIRKFWDCLAISNRKAEKNTKKPHTMAIDMYGNDLSEADDGIETDYGSHNVRVWQNRIFNCHTGVSAQPFYGGPCYIFRNVMYNITSLGLKLHNYCSGLEIYHNTIVTAGRGFISFPHWQNARLFNNLFIGTSGYAVETGSSHPRTMLDYNGYRRTDDPVRFIKWFYRKKWRRYASLGEFHKETYHEQHGLMVKTSDFERLTLPKAGRTYAVDLRLKAKCRAVDAGVRLPNLNGLPIGEAADVGCFELSQPLPKYGPRPSASRDTN